MFNPRREENFSGFLVDPTKQTQSIKDPSKDLSENLNTRASLSGPLIRGPDCRRSGREHNDPLIDPTKANLSKLPGLVAARTTSSQDQQEKPGASRLDTTNNVPRFPGSVHEGQSKTKHDQKLQKQRVEYSHRVDDTKSYTKDPSLVSFIFLIEFCYKTLLTVSSQYLFISFINELLTYIFTHILATWYFLYMLTL